jgi:hypothetical protein
MEQFPDENDRIAFAEKIVRVCQDTVFHLYLIMYRILKSSLLLGIQLDVNQGRLGDISLRDARSDSAVWSFHCS